MLKAKFLKYIFLTLFVAVYIKIYKINTDTSFLFNIYKRNVGRPKRFLSAQTDLNRSMFQMLFILELYPCHFLLC